MDLTDHPAVTGLISPPPTVDAAPLRVMVFAQAYRPSIGGVELLLAAVLDSLAEQGYQALVVTNATDACGSDRIGRVDVLRLPMAVAIERRDATLIAECLGAVAEAKRRFRPDLVHVAVTDPTGFFHLRTRRAHPSPTLTTLHVSVERLLGGPAPLLRELLDTSSRIGACSQSLLDEVTSAFPHLADSTVRCLSGALWPSRAPTPPPDGPPRLLSLGRLVADKGFDLLLRAMPSIQQRYPSTRLLLAGDGDERPALEALAAAQGVADAVTFAGWAAPDTVPDLMAGSTAVIVPSRWKEAFGQVAAQAALMGRPVVATATGGLVEIVQHGITGLLVEPESAPALATAVDRLLADPAAATRMGRVAHERAQRLYSLDATVSGYQALYGRAMGAAA
ncbi:MAG: glycosyltransferase family 4 protein [Geminicoccaceae bacterium]